MDRLTQGAQIVALRRAALVTAIQTLRGGGALAAVEQVFTRRYALLTGEPPLRGAWARIAAQAATCGRWPSDRLQLAARYEELTGTPPPTLPLDALRARVAGLEQEVSHALL